MEQASIVVLTHNRAGILAETLDAMLRQDFPARYEIIVVNDGSTDATKDVLQKYHKKMKVINQGRQGPCKARNNGIRAARFPMVVIMDDDCVPERDWLKKLVKGFDKPEVGMVSSFSLHGGTSTAFRKKVLDTIGAYDEDYFYYREDTDLVFRLLDAGYTTKLVRANFFHNHKIENPKSVAGMLKHLQERLLYHQNDVLLYKKHPLRAKKFLKVRWGFFIDPLEDFNRATGRWRQGALALSSPRGISVIENKTPLHTVAIIAAGLCYAVLVKCIRLSASLRFKKLLL